MLDTKRAYGKTDGVQYYHVIQSFKRGEVTPEQALEIATEFAKEHLPGYETVIGVHVDRQHIHGDMAAFQARTEDTLANLMKQRTILNVRKKKRKKLYDALADVSALAPAKALYEDGLSGMETEFAQYMEAVVVLEQCGIPRERLAAEKAELYQQLAEINRQIRAERRKLDLCQEIQENLPQMEREINQIETKELIRDDSRRR